eukprot:TRINITY_DN16545_c0_g1_i1.p1 TRINITY_DN16545_c0_g1~~TRINITY_DN16545_c0_g1_i1.p1  ORF type:complete len:655 (+),score=97.58 TRINITY_DN16545_c0_g1_i1:22-1965(+)
MKLWFFVLCAALQSNADLVAQWPNVLDLAGTGYIFSDLGAWLGFGLPARLGKAGSFQGPWVHGDNWGWLGAPSLFSIRAANYEGQTYTPSQATNTTYYPGLLTQGFELGNLTGEMDLIFVSGRTALTRLQLHNRLTQPLREVTLDIEGNAATGSIALSPNNRNGFVCTWGSITVETQFPTTTPQKIMLSPPHNARATIGPFDLTDSVEIYVAHSLYFNSSEEVSEQAVVNSAFSQPDSAFASNRARWNAYLEKVPSTLPGPHQWLAVKAINTLQTNWRSPAGMLYHDAVYPSYISYRKFWAWDSWKHIAALALFNPTLAKAHLLAVYDHQDANQTSSNYGMIPDVFPGGTGTASEINWRNTKPPLSAWALWRVFSATSDRVLLAQLYPLVARYHLWWYRNRDHNGDGICEFGATDGTTTAAKWESGMDNAVRFDDANMLVNGPKAWSLDRSNVDLNSFLVAEKNYLSLVAEAVGDSTNATKYRTDAQALGQRVQQLFFANGFFHDRYLDARGVQNLEGCEGFVPLWAGVATPDQGNQSCTKLIDPTKFATAFPFPSLGKDQKGFDEKGYWRGPVWLDQAYFALRGLQRYGFGLDAGKLQLQLLTALGNNSSEPLHEYYDPLSTQACGASHFGWSSAHVLLLLLDNTP